MEPSDLCSLSPLSSLTVLPVFRNLLMKYMYIGHTVVEGEGEAMKGRGREEKEDNVSPTGLPQV